MRVAKPAVCRGLSGFAAAPLQELVAGGVGDGGNWESRGHHAISEDAKRFYRSRGFVESPVKPMTMCLFLESARKALKEGPLP
jgi:hypothetical protein